MSEPFKTSGGMSVMAARRSDPNALDYFPTPPFATRALLCDVLRVKPGEWGSLVWEPAAGGGHMSEVLKEFGAKVWTSDVHDYGNLDAVGSFVGEGADVANCPRHPDWVITNPPFNLALDFALRGLDETMIGVALLLRSVWSEGGDRYRRLFSVNPPSTIAQFCDRVPMVKGRWDPKANTATSYAWFVWDWRRPATEFGTRFVWIPPQVRQRHSKPTDVARFAGEIANPEG